MKELQLQFPCAIVGADALESFERQPLKSLREFRRPLNDPLFQRFIEAPEIGFELFLTPQIAADRSHVHRPAGARVVDAKPVDKEGNDFSCFEVAEVEFPQPASGLHHQRHQLATRPLTLLGSKEIQDAQLLRLLDVRKTEELEGRSVEILRLAIQSSEPDELG